MTLSCKRARDFNNTAVEKWLTKVRLNNWTDLKEKQFGIKIPYFKYEAKYAYIYQHDYTFPARFKKNVCITEMSNHKKHLMRMWLHNYDYEDVQFGADFCRWLAQQSRVKATFTNIWKLQTFGNNSKIYAKNRNKQWKQRESWSLTSSPGSPGSPSTPCGDR